MIQATLFVPTHLAKYLTQKKESIYVDWTELEWKSIFFPLMYSHLVVIETEAMNNKETHWG